MKGQRWNEARRILLLRDGCGWLVEDFLAWSDCVLDLFLAAQLLVCLLLDDDGWLMGPGLTLMTSQNDMAPSTCVRAAEHHSRQADRQQKY